MKKQFNKFLSFIPTRLPTGMTAFEKWSDSVIELSGQLADTDSMKFVLADMIQRLGTSKTSKYSTMFGYVPKNHFVQGLIAAASKQVAGQVFFDIKTKQQAAQAAKEVASSNDQEAPPKAQDN